MQTLKRLRGLCRRAHHAQLRDAGGGIRVRGGAEAALPLSPRAHLHLRLPPGVDRAHPGAHLGVALRLHQRLRHGIIIIIIIVNIFMFISLLTMILVFLILLSLLSLLSSLLLLFLLL